MFPLRPPYSEKWLYDPCVQVGNKQKALSEVHSREWTQSNVYLFAFYLLPFALSSSFLELGHGA